MENAKVGRKPRISDGRRMTIRDLAEALSVSASTVSRALNQNSAISEETRARIMKVAQEKNYVRNSLARSLALKRSHLIGLMVPSIGNPFFAEMARGAHDVAHKKSYVIALCDTLRSAAREELLSTTLLGSQVAGLILAGGAIPENRVLDWKKFNIPTIVAGRRSSGLGFSGVSVDNVGVGQTATEYLLNLGHTLILYLGGPIDSPGSKDREVGYCETMESRGLTPWIEQGDHSMESGFRHAALIRESNKRPSAVFAANDMMAIGLIMGLTNEGVRVPEDIAVVGCDDIPMAALIKPALTTIRVPMYEIGARAMALLLTQLDEGDPGPAQSILLDCSLVIRESA